MKAVPIVIGSAFLWLAWSGHYSALMLSFGAISIALVTWLGRRSQLKLNWMSLHILRLPSWLIFLIPEIIKANIDVARRIWRREVNISPTMIEIDCQQHSDFARALHANAITLTPGTLTLASKPGKLLIHAISREGAESLQDQTFDKAAGKHA